MTHTSDPEWITDGTGDRWHRVGAGGYYRNADQDDVNLTREQIKERYGIEEANWDALIADAEWHGDDAESGAYSLHRDEVGFVTIYEWIDNRPVLKATVKG